MKNNNGQHELEKIRSDFLSLFRSIDTVRERNESAVVGIVYLDY